MKFFLLFLFLYIETDFTQFLTPPVDQEYTVSCQAEEISCHQFHEKYIACGKKIFRLWFLLDIMQSIFVKDIEYNYLCADALGYIVDIYQELFYFYDNFNALHKADLDKMEYFLKKMHSHQVIHAIECLKRTFTACHELLEQIKD